MSTIYQLLIFVFWILIGINLILWLKVDKFYKK